MGTQEPKDQQPQGREPQDQQTSETAWQQQKPPEATRKTKPKSNPPSPRAVLLSVLLSLLAVLAVGVWVRGPGLLADLENLTRGAVTVWLTILLPIALFALAAAVLPKRLKVAGAGIGFVAGLLLALGYSFGVHPWVIARTYAADMEQVDEVTDYQLRGPWIVADNYAAREQGSVIGDREDVHAVPALTEDADTSRYTVLVRRRALLGMAGYEAVQQMDLPVQGVIPSGATTYCEVPEDMDLRLGNHAWPWHNLSWAIHAKKPFAHWDPADAYAYCRDEEPVVVVPLWAYDGWFAVTRVPDGAAVYTPDGLEILSAEELAGSGAEDGIAGPTYPRSVASLQREGLRGEGTLGEYWGRRTGYDTTDKDTEDANAANTSEFTLVRGDDPAEIDYVTPLTPRGTSQSLAAVSVVGARQDPALPGQRSPLVVNTSTNLPATSTLTTSIKESSVQGDLQWTNRWAAGMGVYEIAPAGDGHWTASIGQGQAVSYRADIAPDGTVRVAHVEHDPDADPAEQGEGSDGSVEVGGDVPLEDLTEAELLDLIGRATQELQERSQQD